MKKKKEIIGIVLIGAVMVSLGLAFNPEEEFKRDAERVFEQYQKYRIITKKSEALAIYSSELLKKVYIDFFADPLCVALRLSWKYHREPYDI